VGGKVATWLLPEEVSPEKPAETGGEKFEYLAQISQKNRTWKASVGQVAEKGTSWKEGARSHTRVGE